MTVLPELPAGIYRHYKGHIYRVIGYGDDANYEDRRLVIYITDLESEPGLAIRSAVSDDPEVDAWWDWVHRADGSKCLLGPHTSNVCKDGGVIERRFTYIGPG